MKRFILFCAAAVVAAVVSGCSHNVIQYGDGVGFDAGINPENYTLSLNLRYGKILSAVTRENVEIDVTGKANADGSTGEGKSAASSVGTDGNIKIKIGRQITGYYVDARKAGATAQELDEYTKMPESEKATESGGGETKEAGQESGEPAKAESSSQVQ